MNDDNARPYTGQPSENFGKPDNKRNCAHNLHHPG